ncbi:biotin/lipoyl-binding protein [Leucobacter weissii]|uniref:Biotin/lipoyl-binding protein n=1 Tax=Leucobacter weissii TaxID=1983706 RepID=A0A939S9E2_9MICO|nr:biotin/lipoyl-binding protein [Leucobacter weissii]MBO1903056.1 biotin/lipoyl-binding protein [Leucobacter weissii]
MTGQEKSRGRILSRMRRRTWVIIGGAAALLVAGGVTAVVLLSQQSATPAAAQTRTTAAGLETLEKSVEASGTLTPGVQEEVSFAASGTVTEVLVEAGDTVTKGQKLAEIDTLTATAELLQARADLADAEAQLASAEADADGTTSSDAQIAARAAAIEVAEQAVESAEEAADGTTLTAPAAGLVTAVSIEVGDSVTGASSTGSSGTGSSSGSTGGASGSSATGGAQAGASQTESTASSSSSGQFTIVGTEDWMVSVSLGETEIGLVEAGDQVELETDDGTQLFGVVDDVGKLPSTTSGSAAFPVTIAITGDTEGLYDGTGVTATIVYERRSEVLTVPSSAVTTAEDGASTVTVVDDAGAETVRTVTVGESSGDLTEILDGVSEGELVRVTVFTPGSGGGASDGQGSSGDGGMPDFGNGEMPSGGPPGGGEMPSGGFPGGGQ